MKSEKSVTQRRMRPAREGEFGLDDFRETKAPPPMFKSKYNLMYSNLKRKPGKWYVVGWSTTREAAATQASRLRQVWHHTVLAWVDSEDERGGYDIKAMFCASGQAYDQAVEEYE